MSNSIWKMPDQKPEPYKILVIKTDKGNAYTETLLNEKDWNPVLLPEFYSIDDIDKAERITQYTYLDDLIAQVDKSERLEKAVDLEIARKALEYYADSRFGKKQDDGTYALELDKGCGVTVAYTYDPRPAQKALEQIEHKE